MASALVQLSVTVKQTDPGDFSYQCLQSLSTFTHLVPALYGLQCSVLE
jgi:hypothetical protein